MLTPIQPGSGVIVPLGFKGQQELHQGSDPAGRPARAVWLLVLFAFVLSASQTAFGARRLTVDQFERLVSENRSRSDLEAAHQIADVELSERLSTSRLSGMTAQSPGPKTLELIVAIAAASSFLDPPPSEIPALAPPDLSAQRQMMALTVQYIAKALPQLPNFLATRVTVRYDDTPQSPKPGDWPVKSGLHPVGTTSTTITFQDGRESDDPGIVEKNKSITGLVSWGEFGPILGTTLTDAARGKLAWSHWEAGSTGFVGVFRYSVAKDGSLYLVNYCCIAQQVDAERRQATTGARSRNSEQPAANIATPTYTAFRETTGYHGTISIDPKTGVILRITIEADLGQADPITRAATMVEYATIPIGGRDYTCPVKSVSISVAAATASIYARDTSLFRLNYVSFRDYHRFGASSNIVTVETPSNTSGRQTSEAVDTTTTAKAPATLMTANPAALSSTSVPEQEPTTMAALPAAPPPAPEIPEYTLQPTNGIPHAAVKQNGFVLQANARLVDVGFIAYDKHGHPVTDLKQDEIELYDNGKKQQVRFFFQASPAEQSVPATPAVDPTAADTFSNQTATASASASQSETVPASTILLLDESHLAWKDLAFARTETLKFLHRLEPSERVALYTMDDGGFHVLVEMTQDHALLATKLTAWAPRASAVAKGQESEQRNRQQIDTVQNVSDLNSVNGNGIEVPDAMTSTDPQLRDFGSNPARAALQVLTAIARHLAPVPGHKSLVWISGDSVLVDWRDQAVGLEKESKHLEHIADMTGEALNEAHVSVYALDATSVEAGGVDASLKNRNVELTQAAQDVANLPGAAPSPLAGRNMTPGRVTAAMQQDLHPIQEPMQRVADSTGGKAIRKASDLGGSLDSIHNDTRATYLASFTPDSAPDDSFHTLTLKVPGRRGLALRYRSGYVFKKELSDPNAKFQDAVWRPVDPAEIGLSAKIVSHAPAAKIQLKIAVKDLSLEQQGERWTGNVDVFLVQREEYGGHAELSGESIKLNLKQSTYDDMLNTGFAYQRALNMKPKMSSLRLIVFDENSGRIASVTLPATAFQP
jgi:VWFA-related protein